VNLLLRLGLGLGLGALAGCSASPGGGCQLSLLNILLGGSTSGNATCVDVTLGTEALPGSADAGAPAPSCGAEDEDTTCVACVKADCCAERLACLRGTAACAVPSDPGYGSLAACASKHCASFCKVSSP
jgi:hypothetical protein